MCEKQSLKPVQVFSQIQKLLNGPSLHFMPHSTIEKLKDSLRNQTTRPQYLTFLSHQISKEDEVAVRLKCWVILHLMISQKIDHETANFIQSVVEHHEIHIRRQINEKRLAEADLYFVSQVELPYIIFLKKLTMWMMLRISVLQTDLISVGFSELNKIKEILQMKKIFHNYNCYYPNHEYALNLFEACLHNIKNLWSSVCAKIKDITLDSIEMSSIEENEYLLIKEAETVQQLLIEFIYGEKMCLKLPKELRIRQVNLVKTEINQFQCIRRKNRSLNATLEVIQEKKAKKASMGTMDTDRSSCKTKQTPKFDIKPQKDERLNTDQQIQLLDTIQDLQNLISY